MPRSYSADAHFQLGAAYGYQATYAATIEGSLFATLRAARRAYAEHERVLELDPSRKDAGLIVGMYRYAISSLSLPSRLMARVAGFGGGRERGLRMVEEAASYPSDVQTNARFTLIVIYNREKRFDDALRVVAELQQQYPRNRLLWLEAGSTALQGRPSSRRAPVARAGARHARRRSAAARVRRAGALGLLPRRGARRAEGDRRRTVARSTPRSKGPSRPWVQGRIHTELGKLADLAGDRARALRRVSAGDRVYATETTTMCASRRRRALLKGRYR